jgi:enoyl-CoA hydratase/carnithine racemase
MDLLEEQKEGVAVLTLNRPERLNALSPAMLDALLEATARLATDPAIGAVVLTGAGRGFARAETSRRWRRGGRRT